MLIYVHILSSNMQYHSSVPLGLGLTVRQELAKKPVIIKLSACDCKHLCYAAARRPRLI